MTTDADERSGSPADAIISTHVQRVADPNICDELPWRQEIERVRSSLSAEIEVLRSQRSQLVESLSPREILLLRQRMRNADEGRINERFERKAVETKEEKRDLLPRDTFSLFVLGKPLSRPFLCATAVFAAQIVTFVFLISNIIDPDNHEDNRRPNPMQLPPDTTLGVRMCQVLAIVIAVFSEDNIITTLNASNRGHVEASLLESGFEQGSRGWWILSLVLRLLEGCLALIATFMLIMQTNTARDVLLNFTAVQFVSLLDNMVFGVAELGYLGEKIQHGIEQIRKPQSLLVEKSWLWSMYLPAILVSILSFWLWLSVSQGKGLYLCDNIYVQFGDEIIPDLAHFSGIYLRKAATRWGETVEYYEARHLRNNDATSTDYKPARFGYCSKENAWVFARSSDGISEPNLCDDWQVRSTRTDSYDIISTSPSTSSQWFARKDSLEVPMQWFYLSCYDCSDDFCGEHGTCNGNSSDKRCECDVGWYGLRCEFETPCDSLIVDTLTTKTFQAESDNFRKDFKWPIAYERMDGVDVYNRPVYVANATFKPGNALTPNTTAQVPVLIFYTGRRWELVPSYNMVGVDPQTKNHRKLAEAFFFQNDFHGHWSDYTSEFVSSPSDVDSSTDRPTPQGLNWHNTRGVFLEAIDPVLICQVALADSNIRTAVAFWREEGNEYASGSISSWNTSAVTDMSALFARDEGFNEPLDTWDTSSVTDTSAMFFNARKFNQNISSWDVGSVQAMILMFSDAQSFNKDISSWDTSNVKAMGGMFKGAKSFNQDIGRWDTSSVKDMREMFYDASNFSQDLSKWKTDQVDNMLLMFSGAESFNGDISTWNTSSVKTMVGAFHLARDFNRDVSGWNVSSVNKLKSTFRGAVAFNQDLLRWDTSKVDDLTQTFHRASNFNGDLSGWNTSKVVSMAGMFQQAVSFNRDITTWTTRSLLRMEAMFAGATVFNQPISLWDTSRVENMYGLFEGAEAFNQDLSAWTTSKVRNMQNLFANATSFNGDVSGWDTSHITEMTNIFWGAKSFNQDVSRWDTMHVKNMSNIFRDASAFNQRSLTWRTSSVTDMTDMFHGASLFNGDVSTWSTSKVTRMNGLFQNAVKFNHILSTWDTSAVTDMAEMFSGAASFNQDLSYFNTTGVATMKNMFWRGVSFNQDLSDWTTSSVRDMGSMFRGASSFNGDISPWSTANVAIMTNMFWGALSFNQNLSLWDTSSVLDMSFMFRDAVAFTQTLCWALHLDVQTHEMFCGSSGSFDVPCVQQQLAKTIAEDDSGENLIKCKKRTGEVNVTAGECAARLATLLAEESQNCG